MARDRVIRFGLIGYGAWGRYHARSILRTEGAKLQAIASRSEPNRQAACAECPDATLYESYQQMLACEHLDAIVVALPSYLHEEVGVAVLQSGRHLLMEKPLAVTVEGCQRLVYTAKDRGLLLAVGHELRCSSLWGRVKLWIDQGTIGEPQYVLVELSRRPYRLGSEGWRYDSRRVGSWILEEPIHFFDLARWYLARCGEPVSVFARANSRQENHPELHDNFGALVSFPSGAFAVIAHPLAGFEHHQTVKVAGTHGAIWASWGGEMDRTLHPAFRLRLFDGQQLSDVPIDRPAGEVFELDEQLQSFLAAVRGERPVVANGDDGTWAVAMCLAAEQSANCGRPVPISTQAA